MRLTLLTCTAALVAAPAFAADLGTYRPGTPYHSVIVPTANVCESQCDGDAQCRGWNYVKAAPQAPGVCEFQSTISDPISSAISISGISNSAAAMSSRVVEGNTNTIRVGTAVTPRPTAVTQTTASGRRIVRQPVPTQRQSPYQTRQLGLRSALDGYTGPQPQMTQPAVTRGPVRQSQQRRNIRPIAPQPTYAQPQFVQPYQGRPPIGQPIASAAQAQVPTQSQTPLQRQFSPATQVPQTIQARTQPQAYPSSQNGYQAPQPYRQPTAQPMPRSSATNPVSWSSVTQPSYAPQQPSLYGSLNDDVRSSVPVTSQTAMPTAPSYPTQPVSQMQLAGAQPR
jgi:hypothetical protein